MSKNLDTKSLVFTEEPKTTESNDEDNSGVPSIIDDQLIYLSIAAIIGIVGNLVVMGKSILFQRKSQRSSSDLTTTSTHYFVLSLSISNLGTLTVSLAFYLLPYYISFPITPFSCRYILPIRELFFAVSIFSITFIAMDRFLFLFKAYREKMTKHSYKVCVIMLWVLSYLIIALPFSFVYKIAYVDGANVCESMWNTKTERRAHVTFIIVFNVLLPCFTIIWSYVGIIRRLKKVQAESELPRRLIIVKSKRIVAVSVMMVVAFWITYIPYASLALLVEFGNLESSFFQRLNLELLHAISICLLYSSPMVFPYILIFFSKPFQIRFFACRKISQINGQRQEEDIDV